MILDFLNSIWRISCERLFAFFIVMSERYPSLIGNKYNRLTVVSLCLVNRKKHRRWNCLCDCGNKSIVTTNQLMHGLTISCGCYGKEQRLIGVKKHGCATTNEYRIWAGMKARCLNPKEKAYVNYGGRGIIICAEWLNSFECFLKDMGLRPSKEHSLERDDVNGNYEPSNCRWAMMHEQCRNKRQNVFLEYNGEVMIAKDWAAKLGVSVGVIKYYLPKKTFSEIIDIINERKLSLPRKTGRSRMLKCGEVILQVRDWADIFGVNKGSVHRWLNKGKSICEIAAHYESKK